MRISLSLLLLPLLVACGGATPEPVTPQPQTAPTTEAPANTPPAGQDQKPPAQENTSACAGHVDAPPSGLTPTDEAPPSFAIGAPGKGSLCEAKVFTASSKVTVYRLFTASYETSKRAGPLGAYWTLQKPSGAADAYRAANAICAEWNDLDKVNECQIDVGAKVILGPGQSATCQDGREYPKSPTNQVLIVKTADGKVPVSDCKQSPMVWSK